MAPQIHKTTLGVTLLALITLSSAASAQSLTNQVSNGTIRSFSINTQSAFNVKSEASSSPGVAAFAQADLVISPLSSLSSGVNCTSGSCIGNLNQTSSPEATTSSLLSQGSSSNQTIIIDPSSVFRTSVDTSTATQTSNQNTGSASAGVSASTSLTATEQFSSFTNTLQNTFAQ